MQEKQGFDQFGAAYDLRCVSDPTSYYAICFAPRSGSHFLGHLMYSTGEMGCPLEYFQPANLACWQEFAPSHDIPEVFRYIKSRRTSPNGCFGLKTDLASLKRYDFDALFPGCRLIWMDRDDLLGQAISLVRAQQTNQWISMQSPGSDLGPRFNFQEIDSAITDLLKLKAEWLRFFAFSGRECLRVNYESLLADPDVWIAKIADYIHVTRAGIHWERVLPQKQSGKESEERRRRFLE